MGGVISYGMDSDVSNVSSISKNDSFKIPLESEIIDISSLNEDELYQLINPSKKPSPLQNLLPKKIESNKFNHYKVKKKYKRKGRRKNRRGKKRRR